MIVPKIAILGSTGMLGSVLTKVLQDNVEKVDEFNRSSVSVTGRNNAYKINVNKNFTLPEMLKNYNFIINAIAETGKSNTINYKDNMVNSNIFLVSELNKLSLSSKIPIIHVSTNGVFSGNKEYYRESDFHDTEEFYGKTKSQGDLLGNALMILRCSIVGKGLKHDNHLLNCILNKPLNSKVKGFVNHTFNGITNLHLSRIILGIIKNYNYNIGTFHLVPSQVITKHELIRLICKYFEREDLEIIPINSPNASSRTLRTLYPQQNKKLWLQAGYSKLPSIDQMIFELAAWSTK